MPKKKGEKSRASIGIAPSDYKKLTDFLRERSASGQEAGAYALCGIQKTTRGLRLLARHLILPEDDCFERREAGGIVLKDAFNWHLLERAEAEALAILQTHTHPCDGPTNFSVVDDHHESARAMALRQIGMGPLASCVFDRHARYPKARIWKAAAGRCVSQQLHIEECPQNDPLHLSGSAMPTFDRQVRAFGSAFQQRLDRLRVGVLGLGGLGGAVVELLARLGVRQFVLVDPDLVETSNLNRLPGATPYDVVGHAAKVHVAERNIRQLHGPNARCESLRKSLPNKTVAKRLAECDVLFATTDNHASRLHLMEIAAAYLRPVVFAGVGLEASDGRVTGISYRVSTAPPGCGWCLACGGQLDPNTAARESADPQHRAMLVARGYLEDTPSPAVYWLNQRAASDAVRHFHQLVMPFADPVIERGLDEYTDVMSGEVLRIEQAHTGGCMVCAHAGLRGLGDAWLDQEQAPLEPLHFTDTDSSTANLIDAGS